MTTAKQCALWMTLGLAFLFALTAPAGALSVTDLYSDANTFPYAAEVNTETKTMTIYESYGEHNSIAYNNHIGQALANGNEQLFDIIINTEGATGIWTFDFRVKNNSAYDYWAGYMFEFYTVSGGALADRYASFPITGFANYSDPQAEPPTVLFANSSVQDRDGFEDCLVEFWVASHGSAHQNPNQVVSYQLQIDLDQITGGAFGLRQSAEVPEPAALGLLGLALLALRKRRGN